MVTEVWIVQHDESAHNTILGVFGSQDEAQIFAEHVGSDFSNGAIFSRYRVGYRFDRGTGQAQYTADPPRARRTLLMRLHLFLSRRRR